MIDNTRLIERLNDLAEQCNAAAANYDQVYISSPAHELLKLRDSLLFIAVCIKDDTLGLSEWPDIGYAFVQATETNLPKYQKHQDEIEKTK